MNLNKSHYFGLSLIILIYLILSAGLFLSAPPIWPDEAIYADIAKVWKTEGKLTTHLWGTMIPGIERVAAWNPPLYFIFTIWVTTLFDQAIIGQRLLSFASGLVALIAFWAIINKIVPKEKAWLSLVGLILLITDYPFMAATRIARPEIMIIAIGLVMIWMMLSFDKLNLNRPHLLLAAGFGFGVTGLLHPLGLFMVPVGLVILLYKFQTKIKLLNVLYFCSGAGLPYLGWLVGMYQYWPDIQAQYLLAVARKHLEPTWLIYTFKNNLWANASALSIQILGLAIIGYKQLFYKDRLLITLFISAFTLLAASIWGRMFWYLALFTPFYYLALTYSLRFTTHNRYLFTGLISMTVIGNLYLSYKQISHYAASPFSYFSYCEEILRQIPDNTNVFLFSVPDPYYCFEKRHNTLREFPVLPAPIEQYQAMLDNIDYAIVQNAKNDILFDDFLYIYLTQNASSKVFVIDSQNKYATYIYSLKPKPDRTKVNQ